MEIDISTTLSNNWLGGALFGLLSSIFLVRHVHSQPATRQHTGISLAFDIGWTGLIYGLMDALLLNVMPVLAIQAVFAGTSWANTLLGKIGLGVLAMLGSLLITLTYHLGYPEFRNKKIVKVLVGNSIMTLAVLLARNPLGALISHPVMHIAAVLRGPETTIQLPPHYYSHSN
jgi:peptidoglycan/LPS O-acetylase OafA/YrhL